MGYFEKWLLGNVVSDADKGELVIPLSDLKVLLEYYVVVPRKPTQVQLEAMGSVIREECRDFEWAEQQYNLAIEAGENE